MPPGPGGMLLPADPHDSPLGPQLTLGAEVEVTAQLSSWKARSAQMCGSTCSVGSLSRAELSRGDLRLHPAARGLQGHAVSHSGSPWL